MLDPQHPAGDYGGDESRVAPRRVVMPIARLSSGETRSGRSRHSETRRLRSSLLTPSLSRRGEFASMDLRRMGSNISSTQSGISIHSGTAGLCRFEVPLKANAASLDLGEWRQPLIDEPVQPTQRRSLVTGRIYVRKQLAESQGPSVSESQPISRAAILRPRGRCDR